MCGLMGQEDHFRALRLKKLSENDKQALIETVLNCSYIVHVPGTLTNKPKQKSSITLPAFSPPPFQPPRILSLPRKLKQGYYWLLIDVKLFKAISNTTNTYQRETPIKVLPSMNFKRVLHEQGKYTVGLQLLKREDTGNLVFVLRSIDPRIYS